MVHLDSNPSVLCTNWKDGWFVPCMNLTEKYRNLNNINNYQWKRFANVSLCISMNTNKTVIRIYLMVTVRRMRPRGRRITLRVLLIWHRSWRTRSSRPCM